MMKYMEQAIKEADKAFRKKEIPVGAVFVQNDKIISKSHNNRQKENDVFGHAEIIALKKAQKKLKSWRLYTCDVYVTLKPCKMCEDILREARVANIYYLVDKKEQKEQFSQTKLSKLVEYELQTAKSYSEKLSTFFSNMR